MFKTFKLYINFHGFLNLYARQLVYLGFVVWLYYVGFMYGYFDSSAVPKIAPLCTFRLSWTCKAVDYVSGGLVKCFLAVLGRVMLSILKSQCPNYNGLITVNALFNFTVQVLFGYWHREFYFI